MLGGGGTGVPYIEVMPSHHTFFFLYTTQLNYIKMLKYILGYGPPINLIKIFTMLLD